MFALLYFYFLESLSCLFVSFLGFTFQSCCCRIITHCWFVFYLRINVIIFVCVLCNCDSIASSLFFGFCEHGEGRLNNNDACWGMHWNTEFCGVNAWEGVLRKYSVLIRTSKLLFLVWTLFCFIFVAFLVLSSLSFHDGNFFFIELPYFGSFPFHFNFRIGTTSSRGITRLISMKLYTFPISVGRWSYGSWWLMRNTFLIIINIIFVRFHLLICMSTEWFVI